MSFLRAAVLLLLASLLGGCGYNTLQKQDEQVTSAWSEVLNQYQRRADLVPRHHMGTASGLLAASGSLAAPPLRGHSRRRSRQQPAGPWARMAGLYLVSALTRP